MRTTIPREDMSAEECRAVFDRYDTNKCGEIDLRIIPQLVRSLGLSMDRESLNHAMFDLDLNRNGTISFDEFWLWWQNSCDRTQVSASRVAPSRPQSQQSQRSSAPPLANQYSESRSRTPNPLAKQSGLKALLNKVPETRPKSRNGSWVRGSRPSSSYEGNLGRQLSRNSMRSTLTVDFQHPPIIGRPPRVHGLRGLARPHTAPADAYKSFIPAVGAPSGPTGTKTGFRL